MMVQMNNKAKVELIKKLYPVGTNVVLDYMDDPYAPPVGTKGEILFIDSIGQIHVRWENGSGLAINTDVDDFHKGE